MIEYETERGDALATGGVTCARVSWLLFPSGFFDDCRSIPLAQDLGTRFLLLWCHGKGAIGACEGEDGGTGKGWPTVFSGIWTFSETAVRRIYKGGWL